MLHHEGYEVVGITMKTWDYSAGRAADPRNRLLPISDSFERCRMAAVTTMVFPHYILDIRDEFGSGLFCSGELCG
jgi:tRNA-specific 2-thiouridylase